MQDSDYHNFLDLQITCHAFEFIADLLGRTYDVPRPFSASANDGIGSECEGSEFRDSLIGSGYWKSFALEANAPDVQLRAGV